VCHNRRKFQLLPLVLLAIATTVLRLSTELLKSELLLLLLLLLLTTPNRVATGVVAAWSGANVQKPGPCRCLCLLFRLQTTRRIPFRRTKVQSPHMRLTAGRTFIAADDLPRG